MRHVIFSINLTLDGCCDHTKFNPTEEIYEYFTHLMREADTLVSGRITYQLMVPFWPDVAKNRSGETKAMNEFAQAFDDVDKIIIFSKSLEKVERKNTRIVRANLSLPSLRFVVLQSSNRRPRTVMASVRATEVACARTA